MPRYPRIALATFQLGCGLIALALSVGAVTYRIDSAEASAGMLLGLGSLLGVALLFLWTRARTRRRWLVVLAVITGVIAAGMTVVTVLAVRPSLADPRFGLWSAVWSGAAAVVLWILIMVATLVEYRVRSRVGDRDRDEPGRRRVLSGIAAAIAPLAVLTALVLLAAVVVPGAMLRLNAEVSRGTSAGRHPGSTLTGGTRWSIELESGEKPIVTTAGLAIPVPSDGPHRAGVIMLDPRTGTIRWRYQLRGTDFPPELSPTDQGRAIVVSFEDTGLHGDVLAPIHTLDADTGRILATWPDRYELRDTDPPVLFDHTAHGTNGVIMLSPTGRRMWTYRPERCADPRGVTSTPSVVQVSARRCDDRGMDLLGLDPATGERLWRQPYDSEDPAEQIDVRPGFQLEVDGPTLRRRSLDTGEVSWSVSTRCRYESALTATSDRTLYVAECPGSNRPMTLTAYAIDTGDRLWRRKLDHPATSLAAVDDRRALVLSASRKTCTVELIDSADRTSLMEAPQDLRRESWSEPKPGTVRCAESAVIQLGTSAVVRFDVIRESDDPRSSEPLYRLVGLA